jgi:hypothetical protein
VQCRKAGGSRSSDLGIVLSGTIKSFEDLLLYLVGMLQRILGLREENFNAVVSLWGEVSLGSRAASYLLGVHILIICGSASCFFFFHHLHMGGQ